MNRNSSFRTVYLISIPVGLVFLLGLLNFRLGEESSGGPFDDSTLIPSRDLSFIKRFICISDLLGEDQWTNQKGRSISDEGIALSDGKKHPVNMCHYALFCFDEYKATGNEHYLDAFMAQAKCLMDSSFYHIIEDDKIAYPYFITFHDLRPPWYSALAQSEAICVLIRYYALTGNEEILPVITRLKNFMVAPQEFNCGTMSITPEGNMWYEEYPNSKQERQVLNGFFISMIALYEYSRLFPGDTTTRNQFNATIETVKESFPFYDTGTWLKYNRGDQRLVGNGYMKWQTLELKFLYQLTGDEYFKRVMMLIATYCFNKPYETPGSKLQDYDFSVPLLLNANGELVFKGKQIAYDFKKNPQEISANCKIATAELLKMIDNNLYSFTVLCPLDTATQNEFGIELKFRNKLEVGGIRVSWVSSDTTKMAVPSLAYRDSSRTGNGFKTIRVTGTGIGEKAQNYVFDAVGADAVKLTFPNRKGSDALRIAELSLMGPTQMVNSDFLHYITAVGVNGSGGLRFSFDTKNISDYLVFSRSSDKKELLDKEKWDPLKARKSNRIQISGSDKKYHQFLLVFERGNSKAEVRNVRFETIE